jgi:hypothetical protein
VFHVFRECARVLRKGGLLLAGLDTGTNFIVDETETQIVHKLPFDPLVNQDQYDFMIKNDFGIQFSHTVEEQIKGQLLAGFELLDIFEDTNNEGRLYELNIGCYIGTKAQKK